MVDRSMRELTRVASGRQERRVLICTPFYGRRDQVDAELVKRMKEVGALEYRVSSGDDRRRALEDMGLDPGEQKDLVVVTAAFVTVSECFGATEEEALAQLLQSPCIYRGPADETKGQSAHMVVLSPKIGERADWIDPDTDEIVPS